MIVKENYSQNILCFTMDQKTYALYVSSQTSPYSAMDFEIVMQLLPS